MMKFSASKWKRHRKSARDTTACANKNPDHYQWPPSKDDSWFFITCLNGKWLPSRPLHAFISKVAYFYAIDTHTQQNYKKRIKSTFIDQNWKLKSNECKK